MCASPHAPLHALTCLVLACSSTVDACKGRVLECTGPVHTCTAECTHVGARADLSGPGARLHGRVRAHPST